MARSTLFMLPSGVALQTSWSHSAPLELIDEEIALVRQYAACLVRLRNARSALLRLPSEILAMVVSEIHPKATLAAFSLVCTLLAPFTRPALFSHVSLKSVHGCIRELRIARGAPDCYALATSLTIRGQLQIRDDIEDPVTDAMALSVLGRALPDKVDDETEEWDSFGHLEELISPLCRITNLEVASMDEGSNILEGNTRDIMIRILSGVSTLTLTSCDFEDYASLHDWLSSCPRLQILDMQDVLVDEDEPCHQAPYLTMPNLWINYEMCDWVEGKDGFCPTLATFVVGGRLRDLAYPLPFDQGHHRAEFSTKILRSLGSNLENLVVGGNGSCPMSEYVSVMIAASQYAPRIEDLHMTLWSHWDSLEQIIPILQATYLPRLRAQSFSYAGRPDTFDISLSTAIEIALAIIDRPLPTQREVSFKHGGGLRLSQDLHIAAELHTRGCICKSKTTPVKSDGFVLFQMETKRFDITAFVRPENPFKGHIYFRWCIRWIKGLVGRPEVSRDDRNLISAAWIFAPDDTPPLGSTRQA